MSPGAPSYYASEHQSLAMLDYFVHIPMQRLREACYLHSPFANAVHSHGSWLSVRFLSDADATTRFSSTSKLGGTE
jgi:hypothetical protein